MSAKSNNLSTIHPGQRLSSLYTAWRHRPLASLRWQLTIVSSVLLSVVVIIFSVWISYAVNHATHGSLLPDIQLTAVILIVVGVVSLFILINLLLQPLRRMTEAAQAITLGDLEQRERLTPMLMGDDEVSKLAASLTVMADQLELASTVQQASEQRFRRLFSDASHQLRTPLTSLRGFADILTRGVAKDDPETTQPVLKLIKGEAERRAGVVNDLLILARMDDESTLETEYIDLVDLIVQGVERVKGQATDGRKITLCFATEQRLGVQASPEHLKQVLHILCDNALKYGRPAPDGWIKLHLDKQNDQAIIQVIDNGKGIHPKDLPHVFDRFYRGEYMPIYTTAQLPTGTGLGLAIAQSIVHAHHGTITVASTPDIETVFTIRLPCVNN